ncbi:MAG: hypothetical protein M1829_003925 [Trizodia sp. TS-e1964]|nr:MAG: hypothetical protein M1829_003925 [Trizodia sp. TS-e1964]
MSGFFTIPMELSPSEWDAFLNDNLDPFSPSTSEPLPDLDALLEAYTFDLLAPPSGAGDPPKNLATADAAPARVETTPSESATRSEAPFDLEAFIKMPYTPPTTPQSLAVVPRTTNNSSPARRRPVALSEGLPFWDECLQIAIEREGDAAPPPQVPFVAVPLPAQPRSLFPVQTTTPPHLGQTPMPQRAFAQPVLPTHPLQWTALPPTPASSTEWRRPSPPAIPAASTPSINLDLGMSLQTPSSFAKPAHGNGEYIAVKIRGRGKKGNYGGRGAPAVKTGRVSKKKEK